ncbi:hypothetical protein D3C75_556760 [compost metagenome]
MAQSQQPLGQQVPQPPRGRHQQLRPQGQLGLLLLLGHAAAQGQETQPQRLGTAQQRGAHLGRQLPGRHQHQPLYPIGGRVQPLQQRQAERQCLAAAGLGQRQQILALQRRRNGKLLDAGRGVQFGRQGGQQGGIEVEFVKSHGATRQEEVGGEV